MLIFTPLLVPPEFRPRKIIHAQAYFRGIHREEILPELFPSAPVQCSENLVEQPLKNLRISCAVRIGYGGPLYILRNPEMIQGHPVCVE